MYESSDEEEALTLLAIEAVKNVRKKRIWIHDINQEKLKHGEFHTFMPDLRKDEKRFYIYLRMSIES
ncbi:hypothetical protein NQ315_002470 [Exocentrus adspersus]|uniref:Uncharacterized protein n=1 Tax=Exocentrus adspersus TaxID=1586481 RepID=A0AAV8VM48_9CUCU|nr:hypothetical protein NQ315_002470 [Exocentrus adspersus]